MSNARHRGSPAGVWFRRRVRLPASRTARLVSAAAVVVGGACAVVVPALTANAATETYTYDNHGTYTVTVPQYTTSFTVTGLGGAGLAGQSDGNNVSPGGAGGSGSYITETFSPLPSGIQPGDPLQIEVGAAGGGSPGGSGDGIAGGGGAGGGYTYIFDQNSGETLLIAAGGGGGGGGSGLFIDYIGGDGGTDGGGSPGLGQFGAPTGNGGSEGAHCTTGTEGSPGQNAPAGSADGGGGGGGGGSCGGSGGQAAGGGGGGGGGSGYSVLDPAAVSATLSSGSNTGDGSASIVFNTQPPAPTLPVITSATCFYSANGTIVNPGTGTLQSIGGLTATGNPLPTFSLIGQPSWLSVQSSTGIAGDGTFEARGQLFAPNADQVVDGQYTFPAVATNSAGSTVVPVTVVEEPNVTQPTFLSAAAATATVGQPFSFQASAVGCPPIGTYSISQNGADVPWLTMSSDGLLSGTPTAADAGTHTITLSAAPNGSFGTPVTQTFTLTVNPAAATVPGAPVIGTATAGNGQATVAFTPPASDGGSPVTGYTVTATDQTTTANGGQTAAGTGSPVTITGLTNGDSYTFTVKATNKTGTGPASAPSNAVTPVAPVQHQAPGAPVIGTATAGDSQATVAFTPPASDGGSPVTSYTVTATDQTNTANGGQTAAGASSPVNISGLTNGDSYTFTVTATNSVGTGPASAPSNAVTPSTPTSAATAPGAPVIGTATAGNGQATVAFTPPTSDGGSPVTSYTVTATDQTTTANGGQTAAGTGSPVTITGLTNGDSYTFTVTATNSVGTGPASAPSNAVTPTAPKPTATVPGAPAITSVAVGNHAARVTFRAPRSDGGSHIYRYTVTATDLTHRSRGGQTAAGTGSPVTITGLTNGDSYTFTVTATNSVGTGPTSAPSRPVTLPTVPGAPAVTRVSPGNHAARVCFRAPRSDGGSHIYRYTVTATDLTHRSRGGQTAAGRGSPITITGLTNGDRYTFTVTATNTEGTGPTSAPSGAVTPAVPRAKPRADLSISLTRHPWAKYGSTYAETVTVTNHGPSGAPGVVAKLLLPSQFSVISTHGGKRSGSVVSWTDRSLGAGKSVSFTVTVRVNTRARGTAHVAATMIAVSKDPRPANNWASANVRLN